MIDVVAFAVTVTCLLTAATVGGEAVLARYRWRTVAARLAVVQVVTTALAAFDVGGLFGGHHPRELAAHVAYLAVSVAVLPAVALQVRGDDGRWAAALVAAALVVLAVVVVRQSTTWRADG